MSAHRSRVTTALRLGATVALLASGLAARPARAAPGPPAPAAVFDQTHAAWSAVLARFVKGGRVDYAGLKRRGQPALDAYLAALASVNAKDFERFTRNQRLAFWINAYNAFTVRLILDHYPLKSIRAIGTLPLAAFRLSFIKLPHLRRAALSLNDIENDVIRKGFEEPRIHFAINCASESCPALRAEAYHADVLGRQLDDAARRFLRDPSKNRYDASRRELHLSAIFNWFKGDFERAAGSVPAFVARYADQATASAIKDGSVKVHFLDYDWRLNGR